VDLVEGRHLTEADCKSALGVRLAMDIEETAAGVDPVGREIRWNNFPCTLIGVGKKGSGRSWHSLDNGIILPPPHTGKIARLENGFLRSRAAGSAAKLPG